MDSTELLTQYRADVVDQEKPYLWSDTEIYDYIDDAQMMFCRLTGGLGDGSSPLTVLSYTGASDWVATSKLILKTRSAARLDNGRKIEVINVEDMDELNVRFDGRVGQPKYLIIGIEEGRARLYPFPNETGSIQLLVDRLPLKSITDSDQKLEVSKQHKTGLLLWVKARGYSKQDAETMDRNKAARYEADFRAYCAAAKVEKDRAKHKTRTVTYGGI